MDLSQLDPLFAPPLVAAAVVWLVLILAAMKQ